MSLLDACSGPETVVPGALRGYRTWGVEAMDRQVRLVSTGVPYAWRPGVLSAACAKNNPTMVGGCNCGVCRAMPGARWDLEPMPGHASPVANCSCGFYGWYRPGDTRIVPAAVFGAIEASGRLMLGSHGFRAERVRLLAVAAGGISGPGVADLVGGLLRDGVRVFRDQDELVERFPPDDVSGLIDHTCTDSCNDLSASRWATATVQVPAAVVAAMNAQARVTLADMAKAMGVWATANPALGSAPAPAPPTSASTKAMRALQLRRSRGTGPQHAKRWWQR